MAKKLSAKSEVPCEVSIVGIGASAGGLTALETLFEQLPDDTGAAFVVVQHLSPDYQSHMPELLGRRTKMETVQLSDTTTPKANTVYLLPPGKHVELVGNRFNLMDRNDDGELNLPIDRFFESLAAHQTGRFVAVVLSGTGSDGSGGIVDVHDSGGLVLSQDEDSAQFNGMPLNAMKTGKVHIIAPVPEIAEAIESYCQGLSVAEVVKQGAPSIERNDLNPIYSRLETSCGVDFGRYKSGTFTRRLARRMMLSKVDQLEEYIELLDNNSEELSRLADDLMIGVTRFFRDPDGYQRLSNRGIRHLVKSKAAGEELRVWVAGCATGQEAYSVALLIHEELQNRDADLDVKIFATDVHPDAIRFAQRGVYPSESHREIPKHLRDLFTINHAEGFEISPEVRKSIVFARHDVMQDAPFTNLDLVTCRNLLIYLVDESQERVLAAFTHALKSRGILWLGPSETPGSVAENFKPLDKHWRLFQKERDSLLPLDLKLRKRPAATKSLALRPRSSRTPTPSMVMTYDRILDQYAPPGILVDQDLQTLQIFGDVSNYTVPVSGRLAGTVEDMLAEPMRMPLVIAMQRMQTNNQVVATEKVVVDNKPIKLVIKAFHHTKISETHYFIAFETNKSFESPTADSLQEIKSVEKQSLISSAISAVENVRPIEAGTASLLREQVRILEMELEYTRENLQATIEEVETTNEELQSSNEELTSSNEELQSTNEELHSVNEELHTTNTESTRRMQLLSEMTTDLESVMRESEIGILLVDPDMKIRRATPAAGDMLHLRRKDAEDEPLLSYAHAFDGIDLVEVATEVQATGRPVEKEVIDRRNDPVLLRITPYRDRSGVVMTMTNLRSVKDTANRLRKLTSIVADSTDAIIGVELTGRITSWNRGATRMFRNEVNTDGNYELSNVIPKRVNAICEELIKELSRKGEVAAKELTAKINGKQVALLIRVTPMLDEYGRVAAAAITFSDMTAIRHAERELELRTRAIEAANNGFIIVDALADDMPIVYANEGFTRMTGFPVDEIIGRNCRFLQGPLTDPDDVDKIRNAVKTKTGCHVMLINYRRDGSLFYNDLVVSPVTDAEGVVTHFVGIQNDASVVAEAQKTLEQSEAEYRGTFENAAIGMAHIGMEGEWLRVNQKLCQIVGYDAETLKQKTFQELTHPDDLDSDVMDFARMKRGEIQGYSMEKRYFHRDGHIVWINLTTSLRYRADGTPDCCISLVEDISERKLTEQKLSASRAIISEVIETSHDPFISFDRAGIVRVANRAARELSNPPEDLEGRSYEEIFSDQLESPLLPTMDRVRRSQVAESTEHYAQHLNRWYDARVFPVEGGAAMHMTDVTSRKQTEGYLERARLAAEEASEAKTKFLANMSHEIRSPMSAILGFSDIALRDIREGKDVDPGNLETVIRNGRFLLRIINDILDLSKVEAGKLEVRKSRFELLPLLGDVYELMRHRSDASDVPLAIEFAGPVADRLHSDRSRVEQILVNLIGNALKFTAEGNVRVVVQMDDADERVLFRVVDTGIGISELNLARLFQTFTQVHDRKLVGIEGTGLGLAISKRLAELLGGDVSAKSIEGKGSEFTLSLPVDNASNRITPDASDLRPTETVSADLGTLFCRVLVADDARDVRLASKTFLVRAGASVTEVVNGSEAVRAVRDAESEGKPFACVLMDMQMPELDGIEATKKLRAEGYTLPIIALTAGVTSEEVEAAMGAGCSEFVAKPVDGPDLVGRVAKWTR